MSALETTVDVQLRDQIVPLLRVHGGGMELERVRDGVVDVRFTHACTACPLRPLTLMAAVQPRLLAIPGVTDVRARGVRVSRHVVERFRRVRHPSLELERETPLPTKTPEELLSERGLELPEPPQAVANYVGAVRTGNLVFVSGHGPVERGEHIFLGKLGADLDVPEGQRSAQLVILNALATLKRELGELDRVKRIVKLLVLVNSAPDFIEQHKVANGASDLLVEIFGEARGKHGRSAIGMGSLPFGISVEIEMIVETEG